MSTGDGMLALVYDKARDDWDTTKGFRKVEVPRPVLMQESDPEDAASAIVKVIYADVMPALHRMAGMSVHSHLRKLKSEARVSEEPVAGGPSRWTLL